MSEFLSQDDIDALLQSGFGDDDSPAEESSGGTGFLAEATEDFCAQEVTVLNTLTGREVSIVPGESFIGDEAMVSSRLGADEYLSIALPVSGDVTGTVFVTLLKSKAAILYDLMIMGDGSTPYSDDVKDGISEIFSQVSGGYATFLREKSSGSVISDAVTVKDNDGVGVLVAEESLILDVTISEIEPFQAIVTFDDDMVRSLRAQYGSDTSADVPAFDESGLLSQDEIDSITAAAEDLSAPSEMGSAPAPAPAAAAPSFGSSTAPKGSVDMLLDIDLDVSIELGRTDISIKRILELAPGALVELDRLAGEPVDLMVNNKVVAKGEVVVVDESFGVRIISLVSPEERIKSLR